MEENNKATALDTPDGAGVERLPSNYSTYTIAQSNAENKFFQFPAPPFEFPNFSNRQADASLTTMNMDQLFDAVFEAKPPVIENLLHTGMYIMAGPPKAGKSFLVLQIAYHVSTGIPLWGYTVHQGEVLYLALEDSFGRLQERLSQMYGVETTEYLHLTTSAKLMETGLKTQLNLFLNQHPNTALIIIDTLQKVRESKAEKYSYAKDYQVIGELKAFADSHQICLLVVHHTRKQAAEDAFDMISGTNGLLGAADGAMVLRRDMRTTGRATLDITGRDYQDQRLYISREPDSPCWALDRAERAPVHLHCEPILDQVAELLNPDMQEWIGTARELAELLSIDTPPNILTRKLNVNIRALRDVHGIEYTRQHTRTGCKITLRRVNDV